jgi:hypothetical protein
MRTPRKPDRRVRPSAEGLEDRKLLNARTRLVNGTEINDQDLARLLTQLTNTYSNGDRIPVSDRRIVYQTPQGRTAIVTLYGKGTLQGSTVTDGVLNLVFDRTSIETRIIGQVVGGGVAPLGSIRDANTALGSPSNVNVNSVAAVMLHSFALVDGGFINLTGGVLQVDLNSIGANTEIHMRDGSTLVPTASSATGQAPEASTVAPVGGTGGVFASSSGIVETGSSGSAVGNVTAIPGATATPTSTTPQPPDGIEFSVQRIAAAPLGSPIIGNAQIFAVDPTANALVRFDLVTGNPTLGIPLPPLTTAEPAVGLGTLGDRQVALVGNGQTVLAFDSVTGAPVGAFSAANLAGVGLRAVDGIGATDTATMLVDAGGTAVPINLAGSLATGQAVPAAGRFSPEPDLTFVGGATGEPGTNLLFATVAGHFDTFQPNRLQLGVVALRPNASGTLTEADRAPLLTSGGGFIDAGTADVLRPGAAAGLGAVESRLAVLSGAGNGTNTITLYNASSLSPSGTVKLNYASKLVGLSESFYPDIRGAALVDVTGTLKRFSARQAQGLVLNGRSTVNFVAIQAATDTAIVGRPVDHVSIPVRRNVQLFSTSRGVNGKVDRNGVQVESNLPSLGPVVLP